MPPLGSRIFRFMAQQKNLSFDARVEGAGPDRLIGDEGILEIKAPLPQTQVEYWLSGEVSQRFRPK